MLSIVSGPSGVGKKAVIEEVIKKNPLIKQARSYTTRPPRPGERDQVDYDFTTREHFVDMVKAGQFLETNEHFGHLYGTPVRYADTNDCVILEIDIQGARKVKHRHPATHSVFILPPSYDELERRLRSRGGLSEEEMSARLARAIEELFHAYQYDYWLVNDCLETAANHLSTILTHFYFGGDGEPRCYRDHTILDRVRASFVVQP